MYWRKIVTILAALCFIATISLASGQTEGESPTAAKEVKKDRFFDITMISPIGNPPREKAAQIIARDLEKIGIGINLRYMEFASITPRWKIAAQQGGGFDEGGYDMYLVQTANYASIEASGFFQSFACDQFFPEGRNQLRYCNPKFDELAYKAIKTANDKERYDLVRQAEGILYEDLATIPLWHPSQFYGIRSTVKFPKDHTPAYWATHSYRKARREIPGKKKEDMSLRERTLVYVQPTDIDAFMLGYSGSGYTERAVQLMVYDSMIKPLYASISTGPIQDRGPRPALAKDWKVSEDGKTWTIYLRDDVTWHDGHPFTADDVAYTFELSIDPEAGYAIATKFIKQFNVTWEKLDDYTIRFTMAEYSPLFAREIMNRPIMPKHLFSPIPGKDLARSDYNTGAKLVGTGPWILEEYKPAEYLKYKANENYYDGRPWFDYVVIRIIPQSATAWLSLQTGEADITERWYGFTRELETIKADPNLWAAMQTSFGPQMVRINHDHPILKDIWVRRAISLACNRQAMVEVISNGLGIIANSRFPAECPAYDPAWPPLEYDLEEAKRMMIKAGYDYDTITVKGPKE